MTAPDTDNAPSEPSAPAPQEDGQHTFIGLAPLMRLAFSGVDLKPFGAELIEYATKHPNDGNVMMDLATLLLLIGHCELALATQKEALKIQQLYSVPTTAVPKIRLLALMAAGDLMANTPLEFLLENADIALDLLYVGDGIPALPALPEHDVMFVAVGESDDNHALLEALENIVQDWPRPVLNMPGRIAHLGRDNACALLQSAEGIVMPTSVRIDRKTLRKIANEELPITSLIPDGEFPIIVRPVGSHAGQGLEKITSPSAIADYLMGMLSDEFYIARFVDYLSQDGFFRKYRIMLIDGQPFISHMGISSHWMIHYLNAGMADSPEKRAEEERFMASFQFDFVPRHQAAFRAISERIGLDYVGIDCGETSDGRLLIFEVDSDMIVHSMDPIDLYPYKQPQMQKLFTAFRSMVAKTAALATQQSS